MLMAEHLGVEMKLIHGVLQLILFTSLFLRVQARETRRL